MQALRAYLKTLRVAEQAEFAVRCGTTIGYLRKLLSTRAKPREMLCARIETETAGAVTRRDLRPDDAHLIWPDLAESEPNTPPAPAEQAQAAINKEAIEGAV